MINVIPEQIVDGHAKKLCNAYTSNSSNIGRIGIFLMHPFTQSSAEVNEFFIRAAQEVRGSIKEKTGSQIEVCLFPLRSNYGIDANMSVVVLENYVGAIGIHLASSTCLNRPNKTASFENVKTLYTLGLHNLLFGEKVNGGKYPYAGLSFSEYINGKGSSNETFKHLIPLYAAISGKSHKEIAENYPREIDDHRLPTTRVIEAIKKCAAEGISFEGMLSDTSPSVFYDRK